MRLPLLHPVVARRGSLPSRKVGLSVDTARLMQSIGLDSYIDFATNDPSSVLHGFGLRDP